MGKRRNIEYG
jgi:hypothetical protein